MKERIHTYAGNFLFALNIFIIFILLFESKLEIPLWLHPIGRMHLLLLHFPIVLLLLSMVLGIFGTRTSFKSQPFYQEFTSVILLVGVISAGLTVIMGLFLSREGDYGIDILSWHKWFGVSVFFLGSMMYAIRNSDQYKTVVSRSGAAAIIVCLVLTGHFGAALTHGDGFIWEPITNKTADAVPLEQALVFDHVIKPILDSKCTGCHNPDKLKGKLALTDSITIHKGGKSGKLFVSGNPEISLLTNRIHLAPENKKHMPPSGNTQLTPDEKELLRLWIKENPRFNQRIVSLAPTDSLRLLATAFLNTSETLEEPFDFSPADEETVKMLNTNYRIVSPLAKNSPALSVNIYNKETYSSQTLTELMDVKNQIVSLELSNMPVNDNDFKSISKFDNLRRLNLNFTNITGEGLAAIASLKQLRSLSLSGTKVNFQNLKKSIADFENLNSISLWKTDVTDNEIMLLQEEYKNIQFLAGSKDDGSNLIKLNTPRLKHKSVVFDDSLLLQLFHPVKGVDIRFTTDGSEPDSAASLFDGTTVLKESTTIKARAHKSGWLSSDAVTLHVYRSFHKPDTIMLLSKLNRVHPANGAQTFFDHQLGTFNANSPAWANNWAGFSNNDMELLMEFKNPKEISSVAMNTLIETETSIFPPASIEIWGGTSVDKIQLITRMSPEHPKDYRKPFIELIECKIPKQKVSFIKIIAKPVMKLPAWHKNKNNPALLLVDEVLIN